MVVSYTERNDEKFTITDTVGCRFTASAIDVYTGIRVSAFPTTTEQQEVGGSGATVREGYILHFRAEQRRQSSIAPSEERMNEGRGDNNMFRNG